ncbi:hypothetical protein DP1746 [Desulfotalea psychrophila LSv54]|uniref:Transposase IS200-like domain-containing protein n=2 Tax=Desulfotalea psychrophila TaxID=84980 RepID=Q6AMF0_DESPS|nr:hypothetical protein DP1746 [Desulfotalea psychrophila LSv54]
MERYLMIYMQLSKSGQIAQKTLLAIPVHFSFVNLDEFVIMPNHLHAIIILERPDTDHLPIYRVSGGTTKSKNPMLYKNLSTIVRWYKGRVTFEVHKFDRQFAWQARFYEQIIRNEKRLQLTREYIVSNSQNWQKS